MRNFRTILAPISPPFRLGYNDKVLAMGSCFAEHIGGNLESHKIPTLVNPFGILFNPVSLARGLELFSGKASFEKEGLFEQHELWHSYDFHGRFSRPSRKEAIEAMETAIEEGKAWWKGCNTLLLTLGTAYVFEHVEQGRVVANCHKMPSATFRRRLLGIEEAVAPLQQAIGEFLSAKPERKVIISVSPVRHIRDGLPQNHRSKAVLHLAIAQMEKAFSDLVYYPAYELLLDDLRDYRFYDEDMIHPGGEAVSYIWEHFLDSFLPDGDRPLLDRVKRLKQAAAHRPSHPSSKAHRAFLLKQQQELEALSAKWPELDWEPEKRAFK